MASDSDTNRTQYRDRSSRRARSSRAFAANYDDYGDLFQDKVDEVAEVFRGLFRASLEGFRVMADSASDLSDEVLESNSLEADESPRDAFSRFPGDFSRSLTRALDRGLNALPAEAADRCDRTYRDEPRRYRHQADQDESYGDWATSELRREARAVGIDGADTLSRSDLVSALESRDKSRETTASRTTTRSTTAETPPK